MDHDPTEADHDHFRPAAYGAGIDSRLEMLLPRMS